VYYLLGPCLASPHPPATPPTDLEGFHCSHTCNTHALHPCRPFPVGGHHRVCGNKQDRKVSRSANRCWPFVRQEDQQGPQSCPIPMLQRTEVRGPTPPVIGKQPCQLKLI